jgi:hypothetical protein
MKNLYYYNTYAVREQLKTPDVIAWDDMYNMIGKAVNVIDRTSTLIQPMNTAIHPSCKLPTYRISNLSFADCAALRAKQIWDIAIKTNRKIGILWSGGIDSTTVISSFIKNFPLAELKEHIYILTSPEARLENPEFYQKYIFSNFELVSSEYLPWQFEKDDILITGELNDQLFGSDLIKTYLVNNDANIINSKFNKDHLIAYLTTHMKNQRVAELLVNSIIASSQKTGITLDTNTDFFWWFNFCFKWQAVNFRIYALVMPRFLSNVTELWHTEHLFHFFQTDEFQLWSMNNPQVRYITDWKKYKQVAKEYIFDLDKNENYLQLKIKRPSLFTLFHQRKVNQGIESDFKLLETIDVCEYYNPNNDFNF